MRAWGWSLLAAVLPWMGPADSPSMPLRAAPPCAVALDVSLEAPMPWGAVEWRLFTREVDRVWTPYGVTICWNVGGDSCRGFAVRLRVFVADVLPPSVPTSAPPVVGRILFYGDEAGTEIFLSIEGGRHLVTHATLGGRKVGDWPGAIAEHLLPAVMGRALAHELGHFLLGSQRHSRAGLMAAQFRPDQVSFGGDSEFQLSGDAARAVRMQCHAGTLNARGGTRDGAPSFAH
jgi:hypothetical protein